MSRRNFQKLSLDEAHQVLSYCTRADVGRLMGVCKALREVGSGNVVWGGILKEELHVYRLNIYPPLAIVLDSDSFTSSCGAMKLYVLWRKTFNGYTALEVGEGHLFWLQLREFLTENFPEVLPTLNPPASEEEVNSTEGHMYKTWPRSLKLLYRFHNGQSIPFNDHGVTGGSPMDKMWLPTKERNEFFSGAGYGMFGGMTYYNKWLNMWMLPLKWMPMLNDIVSHFRPITRKTTPIPFRQIPIVTGRMSNRRVDPNSNIHQPSSPSTLPSGARFEAPSSHELQEPYNRGTRKCDMEGCIMFSMNALISPEINKTFFVDKHGDVYTNVGGNFKAVISCCPLDAGSQCHNQGNLFAWLLEYTKRLVSGFYRVEPADMTRPFLMNAAIAREHRLRGGQGVAPLTTFPGDMKRMISLFPTPVEEEGDTGTFTNFDTYRGRILVDKGIEMSNCAVFVPSESELLDLPNNPGVSSGHMFFTYSIRLRLLADHYSRPPRLGSCQLITRHWHIIAPNTNRLDEREQHVDGPGVVGMYPLLSVDSSQENEHYKVSTGCYTDIWPFGYQSVTTSQYQPVIFNGHVDMRARHGSLVHYNTTSTSTSTSTSNANTDLRSVGDSGGSVGPDDITFSVAIPHISFTIPDFIY